MPDRQVKFQRFSPRTGQVTLQPAPVELAPSEQVRTLYRLSDPSLSELGLEDFLDELLQRVQDALSVDTVAILLYDDSAHELVARAAKGIEEEVEQGVRLPLGQGFAGRIAAERVAIFIADVNHADILNPILRQKRICSLLGVPLIVEGNLIGVMHVGSLTPRTFNALDVTVLEVAASRAAPGIERARLISAHQHEHRVAMQLQRSLLPRRPAEVAGIATAARYLPASDEVGGDWYDLFELPRGRIGMAIGDVVGHGIKAAALMGQLRTALRAYAMQDMGPARTLELVDRFVQTLPESAMATAAYAVVDPDAGTLRLASAGHLPPIVIRRDLTRVLEIPVAPPLGAFPYGSCDELQVPIEPGETLVFYTDGLIERPRTPLMDSITQLAMALDGSASPEDACQRAMRRVMPEERLRDDAAIVAIQCEPMPERVFFLLPADPRVLAGTRRTLRRWLRSQGVEDPCAADITLAVGEACTNAIEHAYSPAPADFTLEAFMSDGDLTVTIGDTGQWREPRGRNRGRGLTIMETVMDEVRVQKTESGTEVLMRKALSA